MVSLWVSGFCAAATLANAVEQRWAWAALTGTLAVLNLMTGLGARRS